MPARLTLLLSVAVKGDVFYSEITPIGHALIIMCISPLGSNELDNWMGPRNLWWLLGVFRINWDDKPFINGAQ